MDRHLNRHWRHTEPRRWQPLSDAEWQELLPFVVVRNRPGRPLRDARARMDAIFWTAAAGSAWNALPPRFGKPDTVARHFRRLRDAGLWERLLTALARPDAPPALLALEHWVCCACRRLARRSLAMVALIKRLGLVSALHAPPHLLPKPDLSEIVERWLRRAAGLAETHGLDAAGGIPFLKLCHRLGRFAAGRSRLGRRFLPV